MRFVCAVNIVVNCKERYSTGCIADTADGLTFPSTFDNKNDVAHSGNGLFPATNRLIGQPTTELEAS